MLPQMTTDLIDKALRFQAPCNWIIPLRNSRAGSFERNGNDVFEGVWGRDRACADLPCGWHGQGISASPSGLSWRSSPFSCGQ